MDSDEFSTSSGVLQGCILSPHLFNLFLHAILSLIPDEHGAKIGGVLVNKLAYADDIDQLSTTVADLQRQADCLNEATKPFGMQINAKKTKVMITSRQKQAATPSIMIDGQPVETVDQFVYLGSLLTADNCHTSDIKRRLALASSSFKRLTNIWKCRNLSNQLKVQLFNSLIVPIAIYGCETWTLKIENERNLLAFEMRCLRRIARITYTEHVTNEEVRRRLKSPDTILNKIKRQQLRWLGHVKRMDHDRLPKISLEGTIDGSRPRGRPRKRWIENFD